MKITLKILGLALTSVIIVSCKVTPTQQSNNENATCNVNHALASSNDITALNLPFNTANQNKASPELYYSLRSRPNSYLSITEKRLQNAQDLNDVIYDFPTYWISKFRTVEISSLKEDQKVSATGTSNVLTDEHKTLLKSLKMGSNIDVEIKYSMINSATDKEEDRETTISMTVIPETEAKYGNGLDKVDQYFSKNGFEQILEQENGLPKMPTVSFYVNEKGQTENIQMKRSSENAKIDAFMIDVIGKMKNWTPAKNASGAPTKQYFVLEINPEGGC